MEVHQKQITVYSECAEGAPVIYLPVVMGDGSEVYERCRELDCPPFTLVAIGGLDWNRELSPWECEGTIRDAEPFGGQAAGFLDELLKQTNPPGRIIAPATTRLARRCRLLVGGPLFALGPLADRYL